MEKSIVEYFSGHEGYKCGYCKSSDTCFSHGMWAHTLATLDYQNLIDRGWRRSGKYCYKPTMISTCCPLYTIRCETKKFTLTKSQKKVLKKVQKFLITGKKPQVSQTHSSANESDNEMEVSEGCPEVDMQSIKNIKKVTPINDSEIKEDNIVSEVNKIDPPNQPCDRELSDPQVPSSHLENSSSPISSSNVNRPLCRKAKEIRRERRLQKLLKSGLSPSAALSEVSVSKANKPKSLEAFLQDSSKAMHKLELRLVPSTLDNPLFCQSFDESHSIYQKYQAAIHQDNPEECSTKQFTRFLVTSPFQQVEGSAFGSFHHQYWLDKKLIAVGVLDILPFCISSVYFYYDPDYSFLSLGTYAALREIALTRELNAKYKDLQYYYMGYYIHSCVKMRYKGQYVPSFLLCPETYTFHPIEKCRPKLDISKYQRFEEDPKKEDVEGVVNLRNVLILYDRTKMYFPMYKSFKKNAEDEEEVKEYAKFVGRKCYKKIMLYRDS